VDRARRDLDRISRSQQKLLPLGHNLQLSGEDAILLVVLMSMVGKKGSGRVGIAADAVALLFESSPQTLLVELAPSRIPLLNPNRHAD
jgi:hypothetical protein